MATAAGTLPATVQGAFSDDGFTLVSGVVGMSGLAEVLQRIAPSQTASGGSRDFLREPWCRELGRQIQAHPGVSAAVSSSFQLVQCTYFEKSAARNWLVAMHQDLSIPVAQRIDAQGLAGWSLKDGCYYVQPPVEVLEQLVAVRLHLDPCGTDDGPLVVVPGSHRHGLMCREQVAQMRAAQGLQVCVAEAGTALVMRPLLLHSSPKSRGDSRRRVLHFLFGPARLPQGLAWARAA